MEASMPERVTTSTPRGPHSFRLALRVDSICGRLEADVSRPVPPSDPIAVARPVDAIFEAFEKAWQLVQKPRIEDYVPDRDDRARSPALRELIVLERELRSADREPASPTEYRARFPADVDAIADVLDDVEPTVSTPRRAG